MMNDYMRLGGRLVHGWAIPPSNVGMSGADYLVRAVVAVFGLTANTPVEAIYYSGLLDSNGQPLTGAKRYTITFTKPMDYLEPVSPGFWSVTMYDGVTRFTAPNPINRYGLGSDDNLRRDADGSLRSTCSATIRVRTRKPTGCPYLRGRSTLSSATMRLYRR
jgi:hypothetical protein